MSGSHIIYIYMYIRIVIRWSHVYNDIEEEG